MTAIHVSGLYRYPVKSLGGESLETMNVGRLGPEWDRRWMVTDPDGVYLTQREEPRLALASARIADEQVLIETGSLEALHVPVEPDRGERVRVSVWADSCEAIGVSGPANEWFSEYLGRHCRLVYMADGRRIDAAFGTAKDRTSFTDGYPFLIVGQSSLDDLNDRLEQSLPMNRFRPNLVMEGAAAFEEDEWAVIRIGEIALRVVKPCPRCVVTTTDQDTGERGREPLRTLATYRVIDGKVMFGMNAIHDGMGRIDVGSYVDVSERREPPQTG